MSKEAMKLALGALSGSWRTEEEKSALKEKQIQAIIALRGALADEALERMAENARELGLDYELPITMQAGELDCTYAEQLCAELKLAEQPAQQEPVAWMHVMDNTEGIRANGTGVTSYTQKQKHPFGKPGIDFSKSYPITSTPLYTPPPPQRKPLTDEEIDALELPPSGTATVRDLVRLIEAAHGIKGGA